MYMKTKTKILIVVFVVLYIAFIFFMREVNKNESEEYKGLLGKPRRYSVEVDYAEMIKGNEHLLDTFLKLDLQMLKQGDEYHFDDMFWNISPIQVKKLVPYTLLDVSEGMQLGVGYSYYASGQMYDFDGEKVTAFYEFYEDQLKKVQLVILSPKKPDDLFENIVQSLSDICGQEGTIEESDITGLARYQWNAESTTLQVEKTASGITISVGLAEVL